MIPKLLRKKEKVICRSLASASVLTRCVKPFFCPSSLVSCSSGRKTNKTIMDHPYNGVRLQRHNSLPCKHHQRHQHPQRDSPTFPTKMSLKVSSSSMPQLTTSSKSQRRRQVLSPTNLLSLRVPLFMSSSKTNPYVGSFRHAPPTSIPNLANSAAAAGASSSKSPYVGWFRHAPPSTGTTQNIELYRYLAGRRGDSRCCQGSTATCGSSCASSKLSLQEHDRRSSFLLSPSQQQLLQVLRSPEEECLTWAKILDVLEQQSKKRSAAALKTIPDHFISGHLRGGGGHYDNPAEDEDDDDYYLGSSATLKILAKLGSWFLFPLAYDAESCGYYNDHKLLTSSQGHPPKKHEEEEKDDPLDQQFLWTGKGRSQKLNLQPSLSTAGILQEEDDEESEDDEDDDSSSSSSCSTTSTSSSMPLGHLVQPRHSSSLPPSPTLLSRPPPELEVSVSEIAQAYYAHQTTSSVLIEEPLSSTTFHPHHRSSGGLNACGSHSSSGSGSRLDYVITQIDIARMARNASRHLDVESILHLPTITYQSPPRRLKSSNSKTTATPLSASKRSTTSSQATTMAGTKTNTKEFWSWMMVASSPIPEEGMSDSDQEGDQDNDQAVTICSTQEDEYEQEEEQPQDHVCVICLEHFVTGDRLRVLPCNHSFHVGCIDRWLSGSHSHEECFTSGCPTCKKRPQTTTSLPQSSSRSLSLSGAAGSVVAASSTIPTFVPCGFITTTTTRTTQEDDEAPQAAQGTIDDLNGSHPSWAFAQLGSAMARSASSTSSSISYD
jgi:Ring finger domain